MALYQYMEEELDCSGFCLPALFYLSKDLSEGPPTKTCLLSIHDVIEEAARPWATCAMIAAFICLILFFGHFCLYFRPQPNESNSRASRYRADEPGEDVRLEVAPQH